MIYYSSDPKNRKQILEIPPMVLPVNTIMYNRILLSLKTNISFKNIIGFEILTDHLNRNNIIVRIFRIVENIGTIHYNNTTIDETGMAYVSGDYFFDNL